MSKSNEMATVYVHDEFIRIDNEEEPGVINYTTLMNLVLQQAPTGEAGRLYREDEIKLNEIEQIRIEFLRILKIDHLWYMTNLVKLSLSHNAIKKIEKLDALTKLCELDLSFNSIEMMENLNCLLKLETLVLTGNQISAIEGMDNLRDLTIFSIADNKINGWEHVLYLRKFKKLRSVNISGNPCSLQDNYNEYLMAFLPQVLYLSYAMIREDDRTKAVEMYWRTIAEVEGDEAKAQAELEEKSAQHKKNITDSSAFVENLDGDQFFQLLFLHDKEGIVLSNIDDDTSAVFEEYKINFGAVCHELYQFGIEQHSHRVNEIEIFSAVVKEARETVRNEARRTIDSIQEQTDNMFAKFDNDINELDKKVDKELTIEESDLQINVKMVKIQAFTDEVNQFLSTMWTQLIYNEVILHEQIEDVNETFKLNMADMRDVFVESVRALFSRMRNIMVKYREAINNIVINYINNIAEDELTMSAHLVDICGDRDILSNTLASSHDFHLQTIDGREDDTIHRINEWFDNFMDQLRKEENTRHRRRILEISHFLQYLRELIHNHILAWDNLASDVVATLEG